MRFHKNHMERAEKISRRNRYCRRVFPRAVRANRAPFQESAIFSRWRAKPGCPVPKYEYIVLESKKGSQSGDDGEYVNSEIDVMERVWTGGGF